MSSNNIIIDNEPIMFRAIAQLLLNSYNSVNILPIWLCKHYTILAMFEINVSQQLNLIM